MASEIRVDKINSLSGVGTVTLSPTGVDIAGITTAATLRATTGIVTSLTAVSSAKVGSGVTLSPDGDIFATGVTTSTTFVGNLTGNVTGTASANAVLTGSTDNQLVTVTGANAITGESGLTFASKVLDFQQGNNSTNTINGTVQFSNANHSVGKIEGHTRTTEDDGDLRFHTKNSGTFTEALRISFHAEPKLQMLAGETEIVSSASDGSLILSSDPGQNRSNSYIGFTVDASSVGRMDSNGLKLESGKGINFDPHSASNYNFLDDYEETSWTPIVYSGIDGGATYTIQRGWAVKIGHFVHFSFFIRFSGTGNGNQFKIGGLPYTSASSPYSAAYSSGGSLHYSNAHFNNSNPQQLFVVNNATYIDFYNNNSSNTTISGSGSSKDIYASGAYQAS